MDELERTMRQKLKERAGDLSKSPHGITTTQQLALETRAMTSYLIFSSQERILEQMRRSASATKYLAAATVVLAFAAVIRIFMG